ncbi:MAG: SPOR domain-containing protein [Gammaproteobacteria bacterium]|nr:SPOR domain-containing protein [Gammaproteobacteria bacterium]
MPPTLLDHRSYKLLLATLILFSFGSFVFGYISGYEKAEDVLLAEIDSQEMLLPEIDISQLAQLEAQPPEVEEPGASIDVDSVDVDTEATTALKPAIEDKQVVQANKPVVTRPVAKQADAITAPVTNIAEVEKEDPKPSVMLASLDPVPPEVALGVGGPPAEAEDIIDQSQATEQLIVDDATRETGRYSIQVGMYSSFNNAANRVEELINNNLNAYIQDYKNSKGEPRYNVRFGYFASLTSAKQALALFEQNHAGSGYIARINH